MRSVRVVVLSLLVWFGSMGSLWAWNGPGHELVARIAWNRLDEASRSRLYALLRHHPAFPVWSAQAAAAGVGDRRVLIVQRAAVWPDEIKRAAVGSPFHVDAAQVHANWHYIDLPISFDGTHTGTAPTPNVVTALQECEAALLGQTSSNEQRAICVAWMLHLVGDLHQPLHCAERFSRMQPSGDRGGNEWLVCTPHGTRPVKLHALWDGMVVRRASWVVKLADELAREERAAPLWGDWLAWAAEGARVAREVVYEEGRLPGTPRIASAGPQVGGARLSRAYMSQALRVARERVWWAGCRLADRLTVLLEPRR